MSIHRFLLVQTATGIDPSFRCSLELERSEAPFYCESGGFAAGSGHFSIQELRSFSHELEGCGLRWLIELAKIEKRTGKSLRPTEILDRAMKERARIIAEMRSATLVHPLERSFVASLAAKWIAISQREELTRLPLKLELERDGRISAIEETPDTTRNQQKLLELLKRELPFGCLMPHSVLTLDGIRTPSLGWSAKPQENAEPPCPRFKGPDLWIDLSPHSTLRSCIPERHPTLFLAGVVECWICHPSGKMDFFNSKGRLPQSKVCPIFPDRI